MYFGVDSIGECLKLELPSQVRLSDGVFQFVGVRVDKEQVEGVDLLQVVVDYPRIVRSKITSVAQNFLQRMQAHGGGESSHIV